MRKEQGPQHKLYPSGKSKIATQRHISTHINPSVPKNEKKWCCTFRILQTYTESFTHTNKRTLVKVKHPFMLFFILFNSCKSGGHAHYLSAQTAPFLHLLAIVVEFSRHFLWCVKLRTNEGTTARASTWRRKMFEHFALRANLFLNTFWTLCRILLLYSLTLRSRSHVRSFSTKLPSIIIILCALRNLKNMWWVHRWQTHLCFLNIPQL